MEPTQRRLLVAFVMYYFGMALYAQVIPKEIDMFREVGLLDKPLPTDVTKRTHDKRLSYHFGSSVPGLVASANAFVRVDKMIHDSHDFQVSTYAKLDVNAKNWLENTIVSISSKKGDKLYFSVSLSGENPGDQLKVKLSLRTKNGDFKPKPYICPRDVGFSDWHKVVVRFQDTENLLRIHVDDILVAAARFKGGFSAFPSDGQLRLAQVFETFLEGEGAISKRFRGELQDVKIEQGASNLECKAVSKPCKCLASGQKGCLMNGTVYSEGQRWNNDQCSSCRCKDGQVICIYTCAVCKDGGNTYIQGDTWKSSVNNCDNCKCENGKNVCTPPSCPNPDCTGKSGDTVIPAGQCCAVCKEDQCIGTDRVFKLCGSSCTRTCVNIQNPSCPNDKCKEGCFCANDKILEKGKCLPPAKCECTYKGEIVKPGKYRLLPNGCGMCLCVLGTMHCSSWC